MRQAEALLPDTYALTASTAEMTEYRGKWLVRAKDANGSVTRHTFPLGAAGRDQAHALLLKEARRLQNQVRAALGLPNVQEPKL